MKGGLSDCTVYGIVRSILYELVLRVRVMFSCCLPWPWFELSYHTNNIGPVDPVDPVDPVTVDSADGGRTPEVDCAIPELAPPRCESRPWIQRVLQ